VCSVPSRLEIDEAALDAALIRIRTDYVLPECKKIADEIRDNAKSLAPVGMGENPGDRPGELALSIESSVDDDKAEVVVGAFFGLWVEFGTGLFGPLNHRITPRFADHLHFMWHGHEWYLLSIAGQHAQPFLRPAAEMAVAEHGGAG
jgi:hypothetical protein